MVSVGPFQLGVVFQLVPQVFMKRLELCEDPAAKEYMRYTSAQMLNGGFNYQVRHRHTRKTTEIQQSWTLTAPGCSHYSSKLLQAACVCLQGLRSWAQRKRLRYTQKPCLTLWLLFVLLLLLLCCVVS